MRRAVVLVAVTVASFSAACGRCLGEEGATGGGGSGLGGSSSNTTTSTTSGACHPLTDNDPIACASNKCAAMSDGCGGTIFCDTLCTSSPVPASCGLVKGAPGCIPCTPLPSMDIICTDDPSRSYAYVCEDGYPQPAACDAKSTDGKNYIACCGGPKP